MLSCRRVAVIALLATLGALVSATAASAAPGDLDPRFGSGGVVQLLPSNEESYAKGVAVQTDDKIVIAGAEGPNVVLLRLLPNGEPDPAFGVGGKVVTPIPGGSSEARAVAIQADGKIVIAGSAKGAVDNDFLFARYNSDGSPDSSFGGGDGVTIVPVGPKHDSAEALAIGPNGKIAAAGLVEVAPSTYVGGVGVVLANGTPDASFAGDGTTTFETPPGNDRPAGVEMLADGRILVCDASGSGGGDGFSLVQLLDTGAPDPSFGGGDGIVLTPIPGEGVMSGFGRSTDLELLGDGRIVASGYGADYVGNPPGYDSKSAAARYLADGELDPTFGTAGIFTQQLPGEDQAVAVEVAQGGRLLLAGYYRPDPSASAPSALRLDSGGALDPAFGAAGVVLRGQTTPFGEGVDDAAVDSRDRLVTVGLAYVGGGNTWVTVTRYLGDLGYPAEPGPQQPPANRAPHARMRKVPRKVAAARLRGFSGTASDPDGDALRRVQVALVRLLPGGAKASRRNARSCLVLKNRRARFKRLRLRKGRRCPQRWLTVRGRAKWGFRLKRRLPPGRYVVYARAVDAEGLAESAFSRRAGNRYAFRVRRSG